MVETKPSPTMLRRGSVLRDTDAFLSALAFLLAFGLLSVVAFIGLSTAVCREQGASIEKGFEVECHYKAVLVLDLDRDLAHCKCPGRR